MDHSFHEANNLDQSATDDKDIRTGPNAGTGDPTDGRRPYDWPSRYPPTARKEIRLESLYLISIFIFSFAATCLSCVDVTFPLSPNISLTMNKFVLYALSGMLGGSVFGVKYFYRVVARGYWHQDRRVWRLMSPLIAMTVAFIIGAMIDASFVATTKPSSNTAIISIGFLAGYFADDAVGKMYEIANVLFGKSSTTKVGDGK